MAAPRPQRPNPGSRRPAPQGAGEGGQRAEYVPAPKSGAPPALMLGMLGLIVLSAGIFGWAYLRKQRIEQAPAVVVEKDNQSEWTAIRKKINEAQRRFDDTMKLRTVDDQHDLFMTKVDETMDYVAGVLEDVDRMLEPVRDEDGWIAPEYEGYLKESKRLVIMLEDLNKSSGF